MLRAELTTACSLGSARWGLRFTARHFSSWWYQPGRKIPTEPPRSQPLFAPQSIAKATGKTWGGWGRGQSHGAVGLRRLWPSGAAAVPGVGFLVSGEVRANGSAPRGARGTRAGEGSSPRRSGKHQL